MDAQLLDIKRQKRVMIERHARASNCVALFQVVNTLFPLAGLWLVVALASLSWWLLVPVCLLMSLLLIRVFLLMHDYGHGSAFRTAWLNDAFGFLFGVICGLPQYVWSKHHAYHHQTNGNWARYRGPLDTCSVEEYARMSPLQQRRYQRLRSIWMAPYGGFSYFILNPRLTWLKGSAKFLLHLVRAKFARPDVSLRKHADSFQTPYWVDAREYWHMFWNNLVLLSLWVLMSDWIGALLFFTVYLTSLSLAGAAALILFTVQHNFEHSYATGDAGWDYDRAAILGTSILVMPDWLNRFTINIAYHHVHHLSAAIPNYRLARCQREFKDLFGEVRRIRLSEVRGALHFILWDLGSQRLISVAEYEKATLFWKIDQNPSADSAC